MSEPLQYGDSVTIVHVGGEQRQVLFRGIFGRKYDQAYVAWPLAGEYKVLLSTGQLLPKKVSLWRVADADLTRLREAAIDERQAQVDRTHAKRYGGRK